MMSFCKISIRGLNFYTGEKLSVSVYTHRANKNGKTKGIVRERKDRLNNFC